MVGGGGVAGERWLVGGEAAGEVADGRGGGGRRRPYESGLLGDGAAPRSPDQEEGSAAAEAPPPTLFCISTVLYANFRLNR